MKKGYEKFLDWACTPKGNKTMGRIVAVFSAAAAGTMGYLLFGMGRAQGSCDILVREKTILEDLREVTEEVVGVLNEEGQ